MRDILVRALERRDRLSQEELDVIAALPHRIDILPPDTDIVLEGDNPTESCLVLSGFTHRYHIVENGRRQISAVHVPGDFVDLHGFLLDHMDHSVGTLTAAKVAFIPHSALRAVTETQPHLTRLLWLLTLVDAATHRQWLVAAGRLPALAQIAHFICEMHARLAIVGLTEGDSFLLPISQATLSDAMGLSPVHINRTLQDLRRTGLISWHGDMVTILDRHKLEKLGQFDAAYLSLVPRPR